MQKPPLPFLVRRVRLVRQKKKKSEGSFGERYEIFLGRFGRKAFSSSARETMIVHWKDGLRVQTVIRKRRGVSFSFLAP